MRISEAGLALIRKFEGLKLRPYRDVAGLWTIGYGHRITEYHAQQLAMGISEQMAESILDEDADKAAAEVTRLVSVPLTQPQFDALGSFEFNDGKLEGSTLLRDLNAGDYDAAVAQFPLWCHAHERGVLVEVEGLKTRRAAEIALWKGAADATEAA